jgi:hypothetical protein
LLISGDELRNSGILAAARIGAIRVRKQRPAGGNLCTIVVCGSIGLREAALRRRATVRAFDKRQFLTLDCVIWDLACEKTKNPRPEEKNA